MTEYPVHRGHADASAGQGVAPTTVEETVGVPFWQVIVLGIVTLLFGIVVLAWPAETLGTLGVILLIGGVACLRNVAKGVLVLAFMIALAWILGGLTELVIALQVTGATRTWLIVLAVVSIAIGFVFMLWPSLSLRATVLMTGISALIIGIGEIAFAFQMRRLAATP